VSGTVRPQYMPDEPVTLQVFDWDDRDIAKFNDVHNFRIEDGGCCGSPPRTASGWRPTRGAWASSRPERRMGSWRISFTVVDDESDITEITRQFVQYIQFENAGITGLQVTEEN
jgi:hypothetical protein